MLLNLDTRSTWRKSPPSRLIPQNSYNCPSTIVVKLSFNTCWRQIVNRNLSYDQYCNKYLFTVCTYFANTSSF